MQAAGVQSLGGRLPRTMPRAAAPLPDVCLFPIPVGLCLMHALYGNMLRGRGPGLTAAAEVRLCWLLRWVAQRVEAEASLPQRQLP